MSRDRCAWIVAVFKGGATIHCVHAGLRKDVDDVAALAFLPFWMRFML